ncbi:MAG: HYR domain-containing protein, partial [Hyalangium sp.]|uniref:HYR domain-containing protein n=1 Tax=Hyalangium sp. TaxID=2028555 RepID=UPI00389A3573
VVTGHAPDFHAVDDSGAARLLIRSLAYARAGNALPFLWVESRMAPPAGYRSGKEGLQAAGFMEGRDFLHMNAAQLGAMPASWWSTLSTRFSALVVASDRALLTQAELDVLKLHRLDVARFLKELRGVVAFSESGTGAGLTQRDRYEFLPFDMFATAGAKPPYSVTAFGQQALGVTRDDVNSPAYNHFDGSFGFDAVTLSDANGAIIALAGQVEVSDEYLWANAGMDGTFYGPAPTIPVTLDGSGSTTDSASYPLHYVWMLGDEVLADTDQPVVTVDLRPGVYEITLILSNGRNDVATDEVVVTVIHRAGGPPAISCPANVVVDTAPATCGARAYFPPPNATAPGGVESVSCSSLTGSIFPGGVTPVTCTVVDKQGLSASCGFTVTVNDREPPTLIPPPPTTTVADSSCRAMVRDAIAGGAKASDNCTPANRILLTQSPAAGQMVSGVGPHVIQLKATDLAGNSTTATTTQTIIDVTPPTITGATPSQDTLWPPDHKLVRIGVSVQATDNCGGGGANGGVQCHIGRVTSNEPINGRGDGNTNYDWDIVGPLTVDLRAERAGPLTTRIYTLWVDCTDASGATVTGTTAVTVVHDQRGKGTDRSLGN